MLLFWYDSETNLLNSFAGSSISKSMFCDFSNGTMCQMTRYNDSGIGWEVVSSVPGGPSSDHTGLPTGNGTSHQGKGSKYQTEGFAVETTNVNNPCHGRWVHFALIFSCFSCIRIKQIFKLSAVLILYL